MSKNAVAAAVSKFDDAKRIVAKLMARENIAVQVVAGAHTAYFDVANRMLVLPDWQGLTVEQFDMLIGHEVGHALFTDISYVDSVVKQKGLMSYFNVVEDARIERKMKNVYPGLGRAFYESYLRFTQNGPLFQLANGGTDIVLSGSGVTKPIASLKLIDRINLFFKIGAFCKVPFSPEEIPWLRRIQACADMDEALQIAKELYADQKEVEEKERAERKAERERQKKAKKSKQNGGGQKQKTAKGDKTDKSQAEPGEADEDEDASGSGEGDDEGDEDGEGSGSGDSDEDADDSDDAKGSGSGDGDDEDDAEGDGSGDDEGDSDDSGDEVGGGNAPLDPTSETDAAIREVLKNLAEQANPDGAVRHLIYGTLSDDYTRNRIVPAATWSDMAAEVLRNASVDGFLNGVETDWNSNYLATAKAMAAEFERRKTAKQYQRATVAKTGRLDMGKLHQYKFVDDLFLRATKIPNGQSHGIVMIVDGSGSMSNTFADVIDQVLLFAHFAFFARIPFEAYQFTDIKGSGYGGNPIHSTGRLTLAPGQSGQLVGLVDTRVNRMKFKSMVRACLALKAAHTHRGPAKSQSLQNSLAAVPYSSLGGTPLYTGIMLAETVVARMKRTLRLDKMTFTVVSDGGDTGGLWFEEMNVDNHGRIKGRMNRLGYGGMVVRDKVTMENHVHIANGYGRDTRMPDNAILTMLLDVIKHRHGASTAYFYLADGDVSMVINGHTRHGAQKDDIRKANSTLTTTGQFVFTPGTGVADLTMVLASSQLAVKSETDAIKTTGKGKDMVAQYSAALKDRQNSRKFVNATMPFIA